MSGLMGDATNLEALATDAEKDYTAVEGGGGNEATDLADAEQTFQAAESAEKGL